MLSYKVDCTKKRFGQFYLDTLKENVETHGGASLREDGRTTEHNYSCAPKWETHGRASLHLTISFKRHFQILRNDLSRAAFDVVSFQEVYQFAIFKQSNRWR